MAPLFMALLFGLIEFALAFNSTLTINHASQEAARTASIAGNMLGADCMILQGIEGDVTAPNDKRHISTVEVQRTALTGNTIYARNVWTRTGSTTCDIGSGPVTVPYTLTTAGYPESGRCNMLAGCPAMGANRDTVDNIGVQITFRYTWVTPLGAILEYLDGGHAHTASGWTFQKRNVFRMEPLL
jgi:hypothetical protein